MRKNALFSGIIALALLLVNPAFSQNAKMNITHSFSKSDFQSIVQFVLKNGNRQTYCNKYNNNPHYALGKNVHIYLNPIDQSINFFSERLSYRIYDYDEIVIYDPDYGYCHISLKENKVYYWEECKYLPELKALIQNK
jgi:hypothetical protein